VCSYYSHCIPEKRSPITLLPLRQLLHLGVLTRQFSRSSVAPRILATKVKSHEDAEHQTHALESDQAAMPGREPRPVARPIDVCGDYTSQVSEGYVHGHADAAFGRAADVVAVPGDSLWNVGVDAAGDEEDADVFYDVVLAGDQHDEADQAGGNVSLCFSG
jgi:hypothetical protein